MKHLTRKTAACFLLLAVTAGAAKASAYTMMGAVNSMDRSGHNITFKC